MMTTLAATSTNTSPATEVKSEVKHPWKSSVSLGLTLTRGNKDTTLINGDFLTQKKTAGDEFSLGISGAYGQQNSTDSVNYYKGFIQWNHLFTPRFYDYLRADGIQDRIKDIDYRFTIGPGLGYYLIKNTNTMLAAEAGVGFEAERLGDQDRMFATLRVAERFEHKFGERARLWQSVELLPQANRLENYIVNFEIGLETTITKTFTQKTWISDSYANRPATGKVQNDLKIVAGVAYKF